MNEIDQTFERFIADYRSRGIPPPHILLAGSDSALNESIARKFAAQLGVEFEARERCCPRNSGRSYGDPLGKACGVHWQHPSPEKAVS